MILTASLAAASPAAARQTAPPPAQPPASRVGPRVILPLDEEVALARSAAPPPVSDSAGIYILTPAGWRLALAGANGVVCHVNRSWVDSIEPHCYDAEGVATIMRIEMHRTWLYHQGRSVEDADRDTAAGLADGGDSAGTSEEVEAARVAEYSAWARDLAGQGILVDGVKLADEGSTLIEDEAAARMRRAQTGMETTAVRGFFVIRAATEAEALRLARTCPHLRHGGRIAVRPIVPT
jgi:hypothetical protein